MSGWIALSFLDDPLLAKEHFQNFYENVSYPISLARGAYWLGKTYQKLNNKELSKKWFEEASMKDTGSVGGKGASLGEMYQKLSGIGVKVPNGFTLTTEAFRDFVNADIPEATWDLSLIHI